MFPLSIMSPAQGTRALPWFVLASAIVATTPGSGIARPSIERHTLPNGLEVLLLEEPGRDVASVQVWYQVGLADEDDETTGFAHLLEHLMFTGTAAHPDFHGAIAALGGRAFSGPREDLTYFTDDVPRNSVTRVIALEADRMRGLTLSPAAIQDCLADVLLEEQAATAHFGPDEVADAMREIAFAGSPYGVPRRVPARADATPERCRAFYERFFGPDRAAIIVAGGFRADSVLAAVTTHFGKLSPTGNPPSTPPAPQSAQERTLRTVAAPGLYGARWVALGYVVPGARTPEGMAARLFASYLSVDRSDSLTAVLFGPGERPMVSIITCRLEQFAGAGLLTVMAPLPVGTDADQALTALAAAVARVFESRLDDREFATLKDRVRLEQATAATTVRDRAIAIALAHLRAGRADTPADADNALAAVDPNQFAQVARANLEPNRAFRLLIQAAEPGGGSAP